MSLIPALVCHYYLIITVDYRTPKDNLTLYIEIKTNIPLLLEDFYIIRREENCGLDKHIYLYILLYIKYIYNQHTD